MPVIYTHPNGHVLKPSDEAPGHQLWAPTVSMTPGQHGLAKDRRPSPDLQKHFDWVEHTGRVAAANPHQGVGPWYHGTSSDLSPGEEILPGDLYGTKSMGKYSDGSKVWVSNDGYRAGKYGSNLYEVQPHSQPRAPHAGHDEHHTTGATVIRPIGNEEYLQFANGTHPTQRVV